MGKIKFLKGAGAFPTSGLKAEALYFSIPSDEKFEIGLATSATTLALLNANSANKLTLTSIVGSAKRPVYFTAAGVPVPIDYTIGKSVPENADFTNTAHAHDVGIGLKVTGAGGVSGTTTYSANLASDTSLGTIGTTARLYPVGVDSQGRLCANVPWSDTIVSKLRLTANANDDDVVVLEGEGGDNTVTYTVSHAKKGPASGYTSGNTVTSISGSAASKTIKIPQLTVDEYGHVTAAADENITITMPTLPTALKNPYAFTIQGDGTTAATYDGSSASLVNLKAGTNISISTTTGVITINATDTTYGVATDSTLGLVKIGYTESGKNYPVELNEDNQMYVNVPWSNTNTKVTSAKNNTTKAYITGTTKAQTGTLIFDDGVYLDTTAGMLTATTFNGDLTGNAATATWADTADTQALDVISNKIATTQWVHDYIVSLLYDGAIQ